MFRLRLSIVTLLGIILFVALELAALRSATALWVDIARCLTVLALVIATYRARYCDDRAGVWFGFALGGWAYYLLSVDLMGSWLRWAHDTESIVERLPFFILGLFDPGSRSVAFDSSARSVWVSYEARIIRSILTLIAAALGGLTCSILVVTRRPRPESGSIRRER